MTLSQGERTTLRSILRAPIQFARNPEVIGQKDCPLLYRWTLIKFGSMVDPTDDRQRHSRGKLMLHHFLPESRDRDIHSHPWGFVTIVLRGWYDDISLCDLCEGTGRFKNPNLNGEWIKCGKCGGSGNGRTERMKPGMVRYRPTSHKHKTISGPNGCWTIVITGPIRQMWGFFRNGEWLPWREYEDKYGHGFKCD